LEKEIDFVAVKFYHKKLNSIYIGGGTPTTLEPHQLDRLIRRIKCRFDLSHCQEFTVEAGRPDSITREKLEVLRKWGITRISINPQTMKDETLKLIGRRHTVAETIESFKLARELGFDNINMDLIAGLTGETVVDMQDTLEQIKKLAPDSLTVHALAMKRASKMTQEQKQAGTQTGENEEATTAQTLSRMIEMASDYAKQMNLESYYLYRQKNIAGNFENVGYAKVDKAGIYNILIMEEKQSIVAVGAGASTKIVVPEEQICIDPKTGNEKRIIRSENVKDVEQYISRIDEMIERKGELLWH
jgi:oxygen-independent coproporphyrinogen-3 oxidase